MNDVFSPVLCGAGRLSRSANLPNHLHPKTRVAVFGSFHGGYHVLSELLEPPLAELVTVTGVATDDPSQPFTHANVRLWKYPHTDDEEQLIRSLARENNLPVHTGRVTAPEFERTFVEEWNPDLCLMATFGQKIPRRIFQVPRLGFYNFHHSDDTWPSYPGPDPIAGMVRDGKTHVVITMHEVTEVLDGGAAIARSHKVPLPPDANAVKCIASLGRKWADSSASKSAAPSSIPRSTESGAQVLDLIAESFVPKTMRCESVRLFTSDHEPCYKAKVGIVVADKTVLLRLARFGQLDALAALCRQVVIPDTLWHELSRETISPDLRNWLDRPTTPRVVGSATIIKLLTPNVATGTQHEAIALAAFEKIPVLTDDLATSHEAALHHVSVLGTLDVLNFAAKLGTLKFEGTKLRDLLQQFGTPTASARERNLQLMRN